MGQADKVHLKISVHSMTHTPSRCFPHGINVVVHHAMHKITDVSLAANNAPAFKPAPHESRGEGAFATAPARDSIATG